MTTPLGNNGLWVSRVGLGAGSLGGSDVAQSDVNWLVHGALDLGVNLIDTAPSYGEAESRIGRAVAGRTSGIIVSTKVGYGVEGYEDWTGPCVTAGVDQARRRLGVDVIDLVHLHSCPAETLQAGEVVDALVEAAEAEAIRVPAYSGDGHALWVAIESGSFGAVQSTVSVVDQHNRPTLGLARQRGLGVLAKRSLANAPWRHREAPERNDHAENWRRWRALALELDGANPMQVCLRWVAHHTEAHCVLVGTRRLEHLRAAVEAVETGPLPDDLLQHIAARWAAEGTTWSPLV
jgi:aryl-alcohol dehydrogenase-like predicted oxidoreductase